MTVLSKWEQEKSDLRRGRRVSFEVVFHALQATGQSAGASIEFAFCSGWTDFPQVAEERSRPVAENGHRPTAREQG